MELPMTPMVRLPNVLRILDFEIEPGDVAFVRLAWGAAEIEALF
jgi:hypothetical protein